MGTIHMAEDGAFVTVENARVDAFIAELVAVCEKHGFWLGHEDSQGAFVVHALEKSGDGTGWLEAAMMSKELCTAEDSVRTPIVHRR